MPERKAVDEAGGGVSEGVRACRVHREQLRLAEFSSVRDHGCDHDLALLRHQSAGHHKRMQMVQLVLGAQRDAVLRTRSDGELSNEIMNRLLRARPGGGAAGDLSPPEGAGRGGVTARRGRCPLRMNALEIAPLSARSEPAACSSAARFCAWQARLPAAAAMLALFALVPALLGGRELQLRLI